VSGVGALFPPRDVPAGAMAPRRAGTRAPCPARLRPAPRQPHPWGHRDHSQPNSPLGLPGWDWRTAGAAWHLGRRQPRLWPAPVPWATAAGRDRRGPCPPGFPTAPKGRGTALRGAHMGEDTAQRAEIGLMQRPTRAVAGIRRDCLPIRERRMRLPRVTPGAHGQGTTGPACPPRAGRLRRWRCRGACTWTRTRSACPTADHRSPAGLFASGVGLGDPQWGWSRPHPGRDLARRLTERSPRKSLGTGSCLLDV
jgi:hypothetical protein